MTSPTVHEFVPKRHGTSTAFRSRADACTSPSMCPSVRLSAQCPTRKQVPWTDLMWSSNKATAPGSASSGRGFVHLQLSRSWWMEGCEIFRSIGQEEEEEEEEVNVESKQQMALYCSPPWPVMVLVAEYLEPQTLAIGSCVSKSWKSFFSSDHLWVSHCLSNYPSSSVHLFGDVVKGASPRRVFVTLCVASKRRRPPPSAPRISLRDLIFTVDVFGGGGSRLMVSLAKKGEELRESAPACGLFRFDLEVGSSDGAPVDAKEELRVVWMAVMKGCRGAFVVMDKVGKGRFVGGTEMFSEELPHAAACCELAAGSGRALQSEVWLQLEDGEWKAGAGRRVIRKLTVGLISSAAWRYVGINDALLYLQPFLLP